VGSLTNKHEPLKRRFPFADAKGSRGKGNKLLARWRASSLFRQDLSDLLLPGMGFSR
jgi:hypothetical protein